MENSFVIAIVGSRHCGKSAFIERHRSGNFFNINHLDIQPEWKMTPLVFNTNRGLFSCICVEHCVVQADAYVIMFDTEVGDLNNALTDYAARDHFDSPRVLCGNKVDKMSSFIGNSQWIKFTLIPTLNHLDLTYFNISAKSNYNFKKPFLYLASCLTNFPDLKFI